MAGYVTLLIVLAIALYVCWLMLQPFFNVLLWAAVLAVVFYPMHRRILERTGRPTFAAAVSTLLVIVFILLPVTFITVAVVRELSGAAVRVQEGMANFSVSSMPWIGWLMDRLSGYIHIDRQSAQQPVLRVRLLAAARARGGIRDRGAGARDRGIVQAFLRNPRRGHDR